MDAAKCSASTMPPKLFTDGLDARRMLHSSADLFKLTYLPNAIDTVL